jgi:8-amino-7-oxononanoate synthase
VCCSDLIKQYLVNRARTFVFSTALPPYIAAQIRAALAIARGMDPARARLIDLASFLREGLNAAGFDLRRSDSQIVPVIVHRNEIALALADEARREGFHVRAIRPPTVPSGEARLRLSLHAGLTIEVLRTLIDVLASARDRLELGARV